MEKEQQISSLIYEFFFMRIHFEYYKYGDALPSIDTLCRQFCVSPQTVKTALRQLRSEGYISMRNGRSTRIIFRQTRQELIDFALRFFSERRSAFPDLCRTAELILVPLFVESFRRMDDAGFLHLSRYIERAQADDLLYFYCYVLQKLDNPLAMNLFWEISMFMGLMFIGEKGGDDFYNKKLLREGIEEIISYKKMRDWTGLHDAILKHQSDSMEQALRYMEQYTLPSEKQTPFVWRIYRGRPQVCYSLAIRLLFEIYLGEYRETEYLPSYEKMAKKYGVSLSTIRRTILVLNQTGAAESVNGIGTRVFSIGQQCNMPDFSVPAVRRNLAFFVQSYELIIYSCEKAAVATLLALTDEGRGRLKERLGKNLEDGLCGLTPWHLLLCISRNSPLNGIREIYSKIFGLFLWGYSLKGYQEKTEKLDSELRVFTETMLVYLEQKDFIQCGRCMKETSTYQFQLLEQYLLRVGFEPDELRLSPSIRLILTDE
ncbi:GntR family transcriptional regulator [uncultured Clostridium sp.]|uniref:GntR family transcriptional regulator n=1 Tax=uncultured Clostridium sp. TaxID=59620 RepID=UPI0025EF2B96|nr:GntR family transcriptional regulator [uncultured Clostridium sp.]